MRVYELAKEAGVTSSDVIKAAEECGAEVTNAISTIADGDFAALQLAVSRMAKKDMSLALAAKREKAAAIVRERSDADRKALDGHLAKAKVAASGAKVDTAVKLPAVDVQVVAKTDSTKPEASAPVKIAPISIKPGAPAKSAPAKPAISVSVSPAKPAVRMAPGVQPKSSIAPASSAKVGLTSKGFKPLLHSTSAGAIKITVAAQPKVRPPKPVADYDDGEKGNRKDKKGREGQKSFEKHVQRPAGVQSPVPGGRISVNEASKEISIRGAVVVKDLAAKLNIKPNRLIADLMMLKILASINQRVEPDVATKIAEKYGFKVLIEHARDKTAAKPVLKAIDADDLIPEDAPETLKPRAPVVTFLGHVDHGKTTLMDWIRKEHVAAGEAGGITQQISAYQVEIAGKKITFLDTPGHAAFSAMRARGAQITDIAVLIIAADDGIMPQTEECIQVARQAGVQIMVAITKADKPTANVDRVKQQLQKKGLTPEDWGGDIICCPVSGVTGLGVDDLLENILVQAEVLELQANPARRANGYVIEAELQQGLGPCAMLLVTGGTLKVGDAILIGEHFGKVRALIDDHGRRIREAPPSMPVKATGLSGVPEAGAEFRVMLDEKRARTLAEEAARERKEQELATSKASTLDALMSRMAAEGKRELNVVVKSDTQGSLEAIVEALGQIKSEKVGLNVIGMGTGNVSLTDVTTAAAGKAIIVGFDIGNDAGVQQKARHDGVKINSFRIIYELLDHVKNSMLDLLPPEYKEVVLGHAEIKAIYDIGKLGKIAGSQMLDGKLVAKELYRILRGKSRVWDGKVQTLRHFKDEVKEVAGQQECGVCFADYEDFAVGDVIECYMMEQLPRSL
ncbi:MAG: translation initiation factor IF-2 [Kiritimatiellae bacterium]|nr:translation initiation factor IF-2 [Kiritimatiellia bacterium]